MIAKTQTSPAYWNERGKHQKQYDHLYAELVPPSGHCKTVAGEALRAISKVYYDIYNNGGYNLHMMDFKYYRFLLLSLSDELREVADGLKIVDFMEKLKQFCRCDPSPDDSANDEVVDVVVVWVAKHNPVSV